jgi:hypothetical protein
MNRTTMMPALVALAALAAAGAIASAFATSSGPTSAPGQPGAFLEDAARRYFPGGASEAPQKRLFRLTRDQLDATAAHLLPRHVPQSVKAHMPRDPLQTNYEFAELIGLNAANLGPLRSWIGEIAAQAARSPQGIVDCPAPAASDCLAREARRFVLRAFRHDAGEEQVGRIVSFYLSGVEKIGFEKATGELVEIVLSSPHFLFRKEIDIDRRGRLAPAQLLQAITYTIADAPPEQLGLTPADAIRLQQSGGDALAILDSILASKAAREKLVRFFMAWLEIREPGEFTISKEVFPEFNAAYASAMLDESRRFLRAALARPAPRLADITEASSGADPSQRFGILSQPAVIASHSGPDGTRLVKRGVFWVRKVMCMDLEPPPKEAHSDLYGTLETTERKRIEVATQPAACVGCHKIINPFAFFQESWDALGRWRTKDNGFPIDTSIAVDFLDEGPLETRSPVEALKAFTGSLMFKQCFVRQLFRFYVGRGEEAADEPLLRRMFLELAGGPEQDILKLIRLLAVSDRLSRRQ